jgi:hypothetical protein
MGRSSGSPPPPGRGGPRPGGRGPAPGPPPPAWPRLSRLGLLRRRSRRRSTVARSARASSVFTTSRSRTGSTPPRTWVMSGSSKHRRTWTTASTSRMLARNWFPSPSPSDAPSTSPAMSTNWTTVGSRARAFTSSKIRSRRGPGPPPSPRSVPRCRRGSSRRGALGGEGVEEGGLPHVGESHDPGFEHGGRQGRGNEKGRAAVPGTPAAKARNPVRPGSNLRRVGPRAEGGATPCGVGAENRPFPD